MAEIHSIGQFPTVFYREIESALGCRVIPVWRGACFALVDHADYDFLIPYAWHTSSANGYAYRNISVDDGDGQISMHRMLCVPPNGMEVDHINGFRMDNRRKNLRICTPSENMGNLLLRRDNSSGFKGVYRARGRSNYTAQIQHNRKRIFIGRFKTPEDAARAYDQKARELFGRFAAVNFPGIGNGN